MNNVGALRTVQFPEWFSFHSPSSHDTSRAHTMLLDLGKSTSREAIWYVQHQHSLDYWSDLAQHTFLQVTPSTNWAQSIIEPYRGLPFGPYLHASRPRRPRSLTGPLAVPQVPDSLWRNVSHLSIPGMTQRTLDQKQCLLLSRLPLEIRLVIYEMVLGGLVLHLSAQNPRSRIIASICNQPDRIGDQAHECHHFVAQPLSFAPYEDYRKTSGILALLVTCRQIYSEAISTLYKANVFEVRQNFLTFRFLAMTIPPQRLQTIRKFRWHMRIPHHPRTNDRSRRDWSGLFEFFTNEMPGLQHLFLQLQTMQPMETQIRQTADVDGTGWMQPIILMVIRTNQKRSCELEIAMAGVKHDCVAVLNGVQQHNPRASTTVILHKTCLKLHEQLRLSLNTLG